MFYARTLRYIFQPAGDFEPDDSAVTAHRSILSSPEATLSAQKLQNRQNYHVLLRLSIHRGPEMAIKVRCESHEIANVRDTRRNARRQ